MNPKVENRHDIQDTLGFTLSGVNVSLANGLRRTLLSDIPLIVFKTSPVTENKCNIITNTSRLNNEIIKQRLSCIPIHISDVSEFPLSKYIMEVHVENITDTIMFVTTENFTIKDIATKKELPREKIREIFPPDERSGHFIDFVRLRPKISDELPGESIHLTCEFSIGTAKEDGMFNAVSTSSYGFTVDEDAQTLELARKQQTWKDEGKTEAEIDFEKANWLLLDGRRVIKKDSFDFVVQTLGIHNNSEILLLGCDILIASFIEIDAIIDKNELEIKNADSTMANSFDIVLQNHDYTIGKILEYFMYTKYYETNTLTYCGFKKLHPHDTYSIIRVAYVESTEKSIITGHIKECIREAVEVYQKMKKEFKKL
jgi:DNA-directed RNA polymerase alpha subunit/DNA-directed RNA polymerase subunit L